MPTYFLKVFNGYVLTPTDRIDTLNRVHTNLYMFQNN